MATFDLAEAVVEFAAGSETNWNSFNLPIPPNVLIYATDVKKFKKGDGIHVYSELPDGPSIEGIVAGGESLVNVLTQLLPADEDCLIVIDNEIYKSSGIKLTDLVARLTAIVNTDTIQDANMDAIYSQFGMADTGISIADNGKLAVVVDHKMTPGIMPEEILVLTPPNPMHIVELNIYKDLNCTIPCEALTHDGVFYAQIHACHDVADTDMLGYILVENHDHVTVTAIERGKFKLTVGRPVVDGTVQFTATAFYNADTTDITYDVPISKYAPILVGVYGGSKYDQFNGMAVDSLNNIYAVGYTLSEGLGGTTYGDALIVKFDSSLNILAKKRYGGTADDSFGDVIIDSTNNIYVGGYTSSESAGSQDGMVVKFDSNLNILAKKRYGGTGNEWLGTITSDNLGSIYCIGTTGSEGVAQAGLIVKFDSSLNLLARKYLNSAGDDQFRFYSRCDSNNNIFVCGLTNGEGLGGYDCIIIKFDSSLNILDKKRYGGTGSDESYCITIDSNNNVFFVGQTASGSMGTTDAFIVKFDNNLNILAKKRYGGTGNDTFDYVISDSADNVYAIGPSTFNDNISNSMIIKFDNNLNIIWKRKLGTVSGGLILRNIALDDNNNLIATGYVSNVGSGSTDAFIVKFTPDIPAGTSISLDIPGLFLSDDVPLSLVELTGLTLADITTMTLANSTLTLADITTLTLANSNLTYTLGEI